MEARASDCQDRGDQEAAQERVSGPRLLAESTAGAGVQPAAAASCASITWATAEAVSLSPPFRM